MTSRPLRGSQDSSAILIQGKNSVFSGAKRYELMEVAVSSADPDVPLTTGAIRLASHYAYPMVHPTIVFRRDVWTKLGGYREFAPAADYDFLLRALEHSVPVANLPYVLLEYRIHSQSVVHMNRQRSVMHTLAVRKMSRLRRRGRFADEHALPRAITND